MLLHTKVHTDNSPSHAIPDDVLNNAKKHFESIYSGVLPNNSDTIKLTRDSLSPERAREQLEAFFNATRRPDPGDWFLEIGSGYGNLVLAAHKYYSLDAHGLEPEGHQFDGTLAISRRLLEANQIEPTFVAPGQGERIPFPDASFDFVYSSNVLEHVEDPCRVMSEAVRITRPGGFIQIVFPNFGSFWEGHYGILWPPRLPKSLGKIYVRSLGRDPAMLESLQLLDYRHVRRMLDQVADQVEVLDIGQELWAKRMREVDVPPWAHLPILKTWVGLAKRLGVTELLVRFGKRLHWETPFVLTLRRRT